VLLWCCSLGGWPSNGRCETEERSEDPATHLDKPNDVVHDVNLSLDEKKKALSTWEQGARQLSTASSEGTTGSEEGAQPADHNRPPQ
jgi:hypothetical protein